MKSNIQLFFLAFIFGSGALLKAQGNLGGYLKDRAKDAQQKAKEKALEKGTESLEKQKDEYDASNFNYAICFIDNSSVFEAGEKGNAFASNLLGGAKLLNKEEKSVEERAYTNLKNGEMLMAGNKFYLAEQSFKLAKLLYEQAGKTSSDNYAQTVSDLGLLYQTRGRFNKAKMYHEQALDLRKKGQNKDMLLVSMNNYSVWKKESGMFTEAESDFKSAIDFARNLNNQLGLALILNNLAMTNADMSKMKEAELNMQSALSEASKILEQEATNFIKLRINLACIYRMQKKYKEAEEIYLSAIAAKEKKLGAHPDLAQLKKGLAQLYMDMGKMQDAEKLLLSAFDIQKRKLGENNPATLATEQELANYYRFTGLNAKAAEHITKVVSKKKTVYGEAHPNYVQALEDLALTQWQANKVTEAAANYKTVIDNSLNFINTYFDALNENEKTQYWDRTSNRLQRYFAFAASTWKKQNGLLEDFYSNCINTKGFLITNSSKIRNSIVSGNDEGLKQNYQDWLETKENLNLAYQMSKEELEQEKVNLDSLKKREDELERILSQKSALFKSAQEKALVKSSDIQARLSEGECAVEILELNEYKNGFTGQATYVAFVLKPGQITLVNLGDKKSIDEAISVFRENVIHTKPENSAYATVWKALATALKDVKTIFLSLDGAYHQLSVNALKNESGNYLVDQNNIRLLSNTRDVLNIKSEQGTAVKPTSAFLVGNPDFGKNEIIDQLPGAEKEVKTISALMEKNKVKTQTLIGARATEAKVKEMKSPSVLHIATHGYFLEDVSQIESNKVLGVDINAARENPLLRSGLLLSDCDNVFDENYHPSTGKENGVLTAYEVISLNLDKTDLVVLSACETGLGAVKQGEGVFGLQRAFLIAGTRSLIMSLWSVSDEATMELMTLFYGNYIRSGDKNQAFQDAIRQIKTKYKEPFYWSAFVLLSH
ncbi:MAG TPA: CHAT domain-containing protein [Bacteroidia bacterium]|nr:CHAT domain-containing protein [Bacteroidia bacterium]